jgi:RNA polymerase sigma-70 factor (ECF subfamily)
MTIVAARDQEALWRAHRERLFRFVLKRVSDPQSAEDIVHDVLVRAYQHQEALRAGDRLEAWLYQITRNAIIDHYRLRRPTAPLPDDLAAEGEPRGDDGAGELAQCLRPFVNALPTEYREAVELAELRGLTQQETATRLGLSLSGAKSRVQRARRLLGEMLRACCQIELGCRREVIDFQVRSGGPADGGSGGGCRSC